MANKKYRQFIRKNSIITKSTLMTAGVVIAAVALAGTNMTISHNLTGNLLHVTGDDMHWNEAATSGYLDERQFKLDVSKWLNDIGNKDPKSQNNDLNKAKADEKAWNADISKLLSLIDANDEAVMVKNTRAASAPYESYFLQAQTLYYKNPNKTRELMFQTAAKTADQLDKAMTVILNDSQNAIVEDGGTVITNANQVNYATWIGGLLVVTLGLLLLMLIRMSLAPLPLLTKKLQQIASGNLGQEDIYISRKDEVGALASTFNTMKNTLHEMVERININSDALAASSEELSASSEQTTRAAENIARTIQDVAKGTEQAAINTDETVTSIKELSAGIQQISHNAKDVERSSTYAKDMASQGSKSIRTAVEQMGTIHSSMGNLAKSVRSLGERSKEIGTIVSVINNIAKQTNLLALNAAIEAARAGEAGRGFSVVAAEVRNLAEQSSKRVHEIVEQVQSIQFEMEEANQITNAASIDVDKGLKIVSEAGASFETIDQAVSDVTQRITNVTVALEEMASGAEQISKAALAVARISEETAAGTQTVSASTEEQLASMEEIAASASALSHMSKELKQTVQNYKI